MIKLELSVDEINGVLHGLGNLPSHTGAWELMKKIKEQADPQVPKEESKIVTQ